MKRRVKMCGPRDVSVDSPTVTTATGESSGQDRSSAAGIFVLTVEHVHGGGGMLLFVIVIALVLAWCCARKKCCSWRRALDRNDSNGGNDDSEAGIKAPGTAGWLPRCS